MAEKNPPHQRTGGSWDSLWRVSHSNKLQSGTPSLQTMTWKEALDHNPAVWQLASVCYCACLISSLVHLHLAGSAEQQNWIMSSMRLPESPQRKPHFHWLIVLDDKSFFFPSLSLLQFKFSMMSCSGWAVLGWSSIIQPMSSAVFLLHIWNEGKTGNVSLCEATKTRLSIISKTLDLTGRTSEPRLWDDKSRKQ